MSFAFVFPGQGSPSVGMRAQLAGVEPLVHETFAEASEVLGYDLWKLCQGGPEEELGKTERTQPAMLAAGVATWRVWRKHGGGLPPGRARWRRFSDSTTPTSKQRVAKRGRAKPYRRRTSTRLARSSSPAQL